MFTHKEQLSKEQEEDKAGYKITFTYADLHVSVPLRGCMCVCERVRRKCCLPNGVISHTNTMKSE